MCEKNNALAGEAGGGFVCADEGAISCAPEKPKVIFHEKKAPDIAYIKRRPRRPSSFAILSANPFFRLTKSDSMLSSFLFRTTNYRLLLDLIHLCL
jgi:hypothetical protein